MQIRKKILLLVAMAMLTCAAVSGFGLYGLRLVNANVVQISGNSVPALILVSEMRNTYLVLIPQVFARATADDPEKGKDLEKRIDDGSQNLIKQINDYTARTTDEDEKKALTEALFDAVELHTGLHDDSIYLTYTEFSNWGTRGTMK